MSCTNDLPHEAHWVSFASTDSSASLCPGKTDLLPHGSSTPPDASVVTVLDVAGSPSLSSTAGVVPVTAPATPAGVGGVPSTPSTPAPSPMEPWLIVGQYVFSACLLGARFNGVPHPGYVEDASRTALRDLAANGYTLVASSPVASLGSDCDGDAGPDLRSTGAPCVGDRSGLATLHDGTPVLGNERALSDAGDGGPSLAPSPAPSPADRLNAIWRTAQAQHVHEDMRRVMRNIPNETVRIVREYGVDPTPQQERILRWAAGFEVDAAIALVELIVQGREVAL